MNAVPAAARDVPERFRLFEGFSDLVVVLDGAGTVTYANPFTDLLLGNPVGRQVGRNMADFVHPDDLVRALEVAALITRDELVVPVTPALYRLRRSDGSWCPVEVNATLLRGSGAGGADEMVIVGRYSGDQDLTRQLLRLLTTGAPFEEMVALVPHFGLWRHPDEHYAVRYRTPDGGWDTVGSSLAVALADELDGPEAPWADAVRAGEERRCAVAELAPEAQAQAAAHDLVACWVVPVDDPLVPPAPADGPGRAVLMSWARAHGAAPTSHRYALEMMAQALELLLQWRAHLTGLEAAARRDPLTGLTNRTRFFELLDSLDGREGPECAVLYIDLDRFKEVNDRHGHTTGDAVLEALAGRFAHAVRDGDTVVRLGGDEFAVLCPRLDHPDDAVGIAERIIASASQPVEVGDLVLGVGASVGVAIARVGELAPDRLVEAADRALYQAKAGGRGRWHVAGGRG